MSKSKKAEKKTESDPYKEFVSDFESLDGRDDTRPPDPDYTTGDCRPPISSIKCALQCALTAGFFGAITLFVTRIMTLYFPFPLFIIPGILLCVGALILTAWGNAKAPIFLRLVVPINAVATGLSIGAFYAYYKEIPAPSDYGIVFLIFLALLLLSAVVLGFRKLPEWVRTVYGILVFVAVVAFLIYAIVSKDNPGWMGFFLAVIWGFQSLGIGLSGKEVELRLSYMAGVSFGWYGLITLVVILALSQGECCDDCDPGCDCGCDRSDCGKGKKKRR